MSKFKQFVWGNKRRKVAAIIAAVLIPASVALAAYLLVGTGSGSGSGTIGSASTQNVTMTVNVPNNLTPGQSGNVTVFLNNPVAQSVEIPSITPGAVSITGNSGTCPASWFTVGANQNHLPDTLSPNQQNVQEGTFLLTFVDDGQPDQNGCAGATITVPFTIP